MKTVYDYAFEVTSYDHLGNVSFSRRVYFTDRRKALSYYRKALAFWHPDDGQLCDYDTERVDLLLTVHYIDDTCDFLFSETITY